MTTVQMLPITAIGTKDRLRHDDQGYVDAIAASVHRGAVKNIGHEGLRTPIEVRKEGQGYMLISGLHRLMALHKLGRDAIAAYVLDVDEIEARLLEVEENLVRRDLDALDRAFFVLEFREMFEAAYGAIARGGDQKEKISVWSGEAADRLGLHEKTIQFCLRIAKGLSDEDVEQLRDTKWARNQSALLALCGVPPEKHPAVLEALFDEALALKTMPEAIDHVLNRKREQTDEEKFFKKATAIFEAPKRVRDRFWDEAVTAHRDEIRAAYKRLNFADLDVADGDA